MRTRILCDEIVIKDRMSRTEIVQIILNRFIAIENDRGGEGYSFGIRLKPVQ